MKVDKWVSRLDKQKISTECRFILDYVFANVNKTDKVLDIGCGNGYLFKQMLHKDYPLENLYGVDIEQGHVDLTKKNLNTDKVYTANFSEDVEINFQDKFDYIFAIGWMHNDWKYKYAISTERSDLPKDMKSFYGKIFENINKVISSNGVFVFNITNDNSWTFQSMNLEIDINIKKYNFEKIDQIHNPKYSDFIVLQKND